MVKPRDIAGNEEEEEEEEEKEESILNETLSRTRQ